MKSLVAIKLIAEQINILIAYYSKSAERASTVQTLRELTKNLKTITDQL